MLIDAIYTTISFSTATDTFSSKKQTKDLSVFSHTMLDTSSRNFIPVFSRCIHFLEIKIFMFFQETLWRE